MSKYHCVDQQWIGPRSGFRYARLANAALAVLALLWAMQGCAPQRVQPSTAPREVHGPLKQLLEYGGWVLARCSPSAGMDELELVGDPPYRECALRGSSGLEPNAVAILDRGDRVVFWLKLWATPEERAEAVMDSVAQEFTHYLGPGRKCREIDSPPYFWATQGFRLELTVQIAPFAAAAAKARPITPGESVVCSRSG